MKKSIAVLLLLVAALAPNYALAYTNFWADAPQSSQGSNGHQYTYLISVSNAYQSMEFLGGLTGQTSSTAGAGVKIWNPWSTSPAYLADYIESGDTSHFLQATTYGVSPVLVHGVGSCASTTGNTGWSSTMISYNILSANYVCFLTQAGDPTSSSSTFNPGWAAVEWTHVGFNWSAKLECQDNTVASAACIPYTDSYSGGSMSGLGTYDLGAIHAGEICALTSLWGEFDQSTPFDAVVVYQAEGHWYLQSNSAYHGGSAACVD